MARTAAARCAPPPVCPVRAGKKERTGDEELHPTLLPGARASVIHGRKGSASPEGAPGSSAMLRKPRSQPRAMQILITRGTQGVPSKGQPEGVAAPKQRGAPHERSPRPGSAGAAAPSARKAKRGLLSAKSAKAGKAGGGAAAEANSERHLPDTYTHEGAAAPPAQKTETLVGSEPDVDCCSFVPGLATTLCHHDRGQKPSVAGWLGRHPPVHRRRCSVTGVW